MAKTLGGVANLLVSIWPGFLYACTYYKKTDSDMKSIFWEFEISIWLNALCRAVSLIVFIIALCRIGSVVKNTPGIEANGTMMCLNWTLLVMTTTVQVSLIIFYSLGLIYEEDSIFQNYTSIMMFVNVACTCLSQVFLSFIFHMMAEPIEIAQNMDDGKTVITVRREGQKIHSWCEDDLK